MTLKGGYCLVGWLMFSTHCLAAPSFDERVSQSDKIEATEFGKSYLHGRFFPLVAPKMERLMKDCVGIPQASQQSFVLVADILENGTIANVSIQPRTNTSECFAKGFGKYRAPEPPKTEFGHFPIGIGMSIKP